MYQCKCRGCGVEVELFRNMNFLKDLDFKSLGTYCNMCFPVADKKLKKDRFVEEYKNHTIYMKDEFYAPYWGCAYCFESVEDARARIDNNTVGYYPSELFNLVRA